jgi:enamine deaminase RidA (YjgF/YER057c/UK114 family)
LTLRPLPGEAPADFFARLAAVLLEHEAAVAWQVVFGDLKARPAGLQAMRKAWGEADWPVTWIQGDACGTGPLAGTHVTAIAGVPVETLWLEGRPVGRAYTDDLAKHCLIGDLRPANASRSEADQCKEIYARLEAVLESNGLTFAQVVRTWFFLHEILEWYEHFNIVRNEFFRTKGLCGGPLPASTGICGKSRPGSALAISAWAVQPLGGRLRVRELFSPLQCPAPKYGSGFSRAMELAAPDHARVLVSGTASIHPDGSSAHLEDVDRQIVLTMDVVAAILAQRKLTFADATRATAYFKRPADAPALARWCAAQGVKPLPVVLAKASVCRDELLFEIELDAMKTGPGA